MVDNGVLLAEKRELGRVLVRASTGDADGVARALGRLIGWSFLSGPGHQIILAAMVRVVAARGVEALDQFSLSEELLRAGHLAAAGGPAYLMELEPLVDDEAEPGGPWTTWRTGPDAGEIFALGLSVGTHNALLKAGVRGREELEQKIRARKRIPGIGPTRAREILNRLTARGGLRQ